MTREPVHPSFLAHWSRSLMGKAASLPENSIQRIVRPLVGGGSPSPAFAGEGARGRGPLREEVEIGASRRPVVVPGRIVDRTASAGRGLDDRSWVHDLQGGLGLAELGRWLFGGILGEHW